MIIVEEYNQIVNYDILSLIVFLSLQLQHYNVPLRHYDVNAVITAELLWIL